MCLTAFCIVENIMNQLAFAVTEAHIGIIKQLSMHEEDACQAETELKTS